jgi:hypothetical protein
MKKLKFFPPSSSFFAFFLYLIFVIIDAPYDYFLWCKCDHEKTFVIFFLLGVMWTYVEVSFEVQ